MTVTLDLPPEAQARLEAEAGRRGITIDQLVAEIAAAFAGSASGDEPQHRLSIIGIGHSGRGDLARRHRAIRTEQTTGLGARDL